MKLKRLSTLLLSAVIGISPVSALAADGFTDVPADAWYLPYINKVVDLGMMNGIGNNQFAPNAEITRAEMAQILYNYYNRPETPDYVSPFADTQGMWFEEAATFCKGMGFITGMADGSFSGGTALTRQQFAVILHRFWLSYAVSQMGGPVNPFDYYPDGKEVADWALGGMYWAIAMHIIGQSEYLRPNAPTTRAEAAKMLVTFDEYAFGSSPVGRPTGISGKMRAALPSIHFTWDGSFDADASNAATQVSAMEFASEGNSLTATLTVGAPGSETVETSSPLEMGDNFLFIDNPYVSGSRNALGASVTFESLEIGSKTFENAAAVMKIFLGKDGRTYLSLVFDNNEINSLVNHNGVSGEGIRLAATNSSWYELINYGFGL